MPCGQSRWHLMLITARVPSSMCPVHWPLHSGYWIHDIQKSIQKCCINNHYDGTEYGFRFHDDWWRRQVLLWWWWPFHDDLMTTKQHLVMSFLVFIKCCSYICCCTTNIMLHENIYFNSVLDIMHYSTSCDVPSDSLTTKWVQRRYKS